MKQIRSICKAVPIVLLLLSALLPVSAQEPSPTGAESGAVDRGRLVFVGESTTAHLRARGVLPGGTATDQVLAPRSGTMTLDRRVLSARVVEPRSGEELPLVEAVARRRPEILVLSFGLNGILGFLARPADYTEPYRALIRAVHEVSPGTAVVLQTVYPVAERPAEWKFDRSPAAINAGIAELNRLLPQIAAEGALVADTAAVLRDENGFLRAGYTTDGIHLDRDGYEAVLSALDSALAGAGL